MVEGIQHQKHLKKLERLIRKIYRHHLDQVQSKLDYFSSKHHKFQRETYFFFNLDFPVE